MWLWLFESYNGYQLPRGSSRSCVCWATSHCWDTHRSLSIFRTCLHQLLNYRDDRHYALCQVETSSCRGHVDELATGLSWLVHHECGTGYKSICNCCCQQTCLVVNWKHTCLSLDMMVSPIGSRISSYLSLLPVFSCDRRGQFLQWIVGHTVIASKGSCIWRFGCRDGLTCRFPSDALLCDGGDKCCTLVMQSVYGRRGNRLICSVMMCSQSSSRGCSDCTN